jgi:hypothetical protein
MMITRDPSINFSTKDQNFSRHFSAISMIFRRCPLCCVFIGNKSEQDERISWLNSLQTQLFTLQQLAGDSSGDIAGTS